MPVPAPFPSDRWSTVDEHVERILEAIDPLTPYDQPLLEALGLPVSEQIVSWVRLPLQFLLIWWAWRIARDGDIKEAQPPQLRTNWKRPGPKGFSSGSPSTFGRTKQTTNGSTLQQG